MLVAGSVDSNWYLGLTLGFVIVTVVVILVAVILSYAARISDQTQLANEGLEEVRAGTAPLWEVQNTNKAGIAILGATRTARQAVVATVTGAPPPESAAAPPAVTAQAEPVAPPGPRPDSGPASPPGVLGPDSYPNRGETA
jgi:hypothetical protein